MRIISGKYGRRRFDVPKGFKLRPTTDLAKEALFGMITSMLNCEGTRILDLFAGTGNIGLEFASRGVEWVDMVEKQPKQVAFIRSVIKELHAEGEAAVHVGNVFKWLTPQAEATATAPYDLIFADPPYALESLGELPRLVFSSGLLQPEGIFILEHPESYDFSQHPFFVKHKQYSAVNFSVFQYCP